MKELLLVAALGLCLVVCIDADCRAASANDCLTLAHAEQLPPTDRLGAYCPAAAALIYNVSICLKSCDFIASSSIQDLTLSINNACSASPDCGSVVSLFSDYISCFDRIGGLQSLLDSIVATFNAKGSTVTLCRSLSLGRSCQKTSTGKCPLLGVLDDALYMKYPLLASCQHICGSENVPDPSDSSACNNSEAMVAAIEKNCNIACSISATPDPVTICAVPIGDGQYREFLQDQANCILRYSQGCTDVERRFLLPRLNTYAIINLLLPCSNPIQIRGVTVQPAGLSPDYPEILRCNYIAQINTCFQLDLSDSIRPDVIEKLFNGNFLLDPFCQLQSDGRLNRSQLLKSCDDLYLRCRLPVAEVYSRTTTYDNSYGVSLGPFLLDSSGLNTILASLTCPNPRPPTPCVSVRQTPTAAAAATLRPTPATTRRSTPKKRPMTPAGTPSTTRHN